MHSNVHVLDDFIGKAAESHAASSNDKPVTDRWENTSLRNEPFFFLMLAGSCENINPNVFSDWHLELNANQSDRSARNLARGLKK